MKCVICDRGMKEGVNLHRINAKGKPGVWVCDEHVKQTDTKPIDADTEQLVKAITGV
jgi:hypothetical protein